LPYDFIVLRQKLLLAGVVDLISFLFEFQRLGTVAVPGWPLTQQHGPLQRWQSQYGIFNVYATVWRFFLTSMELQILQAYIEMVGIDFWNFT
jgi:hypothetical protein